jgi:AraC-like DNA-binding protein
MSVSSQAEQPTSYIATVIAVAKAMDSYGLDGTATLAQAGIDVNSTPAFDARVPTGLLHQAIISAPEGTLDPLFGLKFAEFVWPGSYHAFGVMITSSTTLRACCHRLRRYYAYINTVDCIAFDEHGCLSYSDASLGGDKLSILESTYHDIGWAATMLKLIRFIASPDYAPEYVCLAVPAPEGYTQQLTDYFGCDIRYGAEQNSLCFKEDDLDKPLAGGNAELARHSECLVYNYLKDFVQFGVINRARMALFELLPRGNFDLDSLAEQMETPSDQLAAELKGAGTNYQQLLADVRRELAEEYIERSDLSVNEIAYMLGFSDCSNFARSFRRWMGTSPSEYRENKRGG